jgi:branched-chain amino acid transport system substrate-binding protein
MLARGGQPIPVDVRQLGGEGRAVLTSSAETQPSFEDKEGGVYTRYLVEGVEKGSADENNDGSITVDKLHKFAKRKTQEAQRLTKPEIYASEEGYTIQIAKSPTHDPVVLYRKEAEKLAGNGEKLTENVDTGKVDFSPPTLKGLRIRCAYHKLSPDQCKAVREEVLQPFQKYKENLRDYERAFLEEINRASTLAGLDRDGLRYLQWALGISDKDVQQIESRLICSLEDDTPQTGEEHEGNDNPDNKPEISSGVGVTGENGDIGSFNPDSPGAFQQPQPPRGWMEQKIGRQNLNAWAAIWKITLILISIASPFIIIHKQEIAEIKKEICFRNCKPVSSSDSPSSKGPDPYTIANENNQRVQAESNSYAVYTVLVSLPQNSDRALEMLRGVTQVQQEVNQEGGLLKSNGGLLRLGIINDRDDPDRAKKIAAAAIDDKTILAVIGHWSAPVSEAAMEVYNQARELVFITPITIKAERDLPWASYSFFVNASSDSGGQILGDYMVQDLKDKKKAMVFYDSRNSYTESLKDKFTAVIKSHGRDSEEVNLYNPESNEVISEAEIKAKIDKLNPNEDVLAIFPADSSTDIALQVVKKAGGKFSLIGDMANLYALKTLKEPESNNMVLAPSWHFDDDLDDNPGDDRPSFSCNALNLWEQRVNWATAMSYIAARTLVSAMSLTSSSGEKPNRSSIHQKIQDPALKVFNSQGRSYWKARLVKVVPVNSIPNLIYGPGKNTDYDFIPYEGSKQTACKPKTSPPADGV